MQGSSNREIVVKTSLGMNQDLISKISKKKRWWSGSSGTESFLYSTLVLFRSV
jgi:hypothetical protein